MGKKTLNCPKRWFQIEHCVAITTFEFKIFLHYLSGIYSLIESFRLHGEDNYEDDIQF